MVHEIHLGQNANSSPAQRVDMAGKLESLRVYDIDVGGRDSEDDTIWLCDKL